MNIGIDFYVVQFIVESTAKKKNHYVFNFSLFPTLEAYLAFYQRYVMFSPFQCLITPYSSQCLVQSRQEIADEEMS